MREIKQKSNMANIAPRCTQGPTAPVTPMPQQSPSLPAPQSQPSTQIPTTSIPSPIAKILSKMRMNERNANIQEEGLMELRNLAYNNENNKVKIADAGGITTILSAMKTHSSNATVQENGCGALWNLALN